MSELQQALAKLDEVVAKLDLLIGLIVAEDDDEEPSRALDGSMNGGARDEGQSLG
jgi:hypothetical protein